MGLPKINIIAQRKYSVSETLKNLKGDDGIMNTSEEARAIHDYYLLMLGQDLNSTDRERIVIANRSAEEFLEYGRNENLWTLLSDLVDYGKDLYAKYFKSADSKKLADNK